MVNNKILNILVSENICERGLATVETNFSGFLGQIPKEPAKCIGIYNTDGSNPIRTYNNQYVENDGLSIIVQDYDVKVAETKIKEIRDLLDDLNFSAFMEPEELIGINRTSNIIALGRDESVNEAIYSFSINYQILN